jgi:hypothetical protein
LPFFEEKMTLNVNMASVGDHPPLIGGANFGGKGKGKGQGQGQGQGRGSGQGNGYRRTKPDRGKDGKFKKNENSDCFFTFISTKESTNVRDQLYVVDKVVRWYDNFNIMFELHKHGNRLERLAKSSDDAKVPIELSTALKGLLGQSERIKLYYSKAIEERNRLKELLSREGEHEFYAKDGPHLPIFDQDELASLFRQGNLMYGNHNLREFCKLNCTSLYEIAKTAIRQSASATRTAGTTKRGGIENAFRELLYQKDASTFFAVFEPEDPAAEGRVVKFRIGLQAADVQASEVITKDEFEQIRGNAVTVIMATGLDEMRQLLFQGGKTKDQPTRQTQTFRTQVTGSRSRSRRTGRTGP